MSQRNTCISSPVSILSASVSKSATPYCYDTATNPIALIHLTAPKTRCADASLFCPHRKKVESRPCAYTAELTAPAKYGNTPTPVPLAAVKPEGWGGGKKSGIAVPLCLHCSWWAACVYGGERGKGENCRHRHRLALPHASERQGRQKIHTCSCIRNIGLEI